MSDSAKPSIVSLGTLLKKHEKKEVEEILSTFVPVYKDSTPAEFLYRRAIIMEQKDLSRTYIATSSNMEIFGFFTLGIKCLRIHEGNQLSKTMLRNMNIEESTGVAQSYLLGQLCRAEGSEAGFGTILMEEALKMARICMEIVGCRMIRLDCSDDMVRYYTKAGFKIIGRNPEGNLNQMMSFLK